MKKLTYILICLTLLFSCTENKNNEEFIVACTTNIIGDAALNILPDSIDGKKVIIKTIMGPGVDPHLYKSKSSDNQLFNNADLILYSGLHLEGKLSSILEEVGKSKPSIAIGEQVDESKLISATDFGGSHDPHFWFDVELYKEAIQNSINKLELTFKDFNSYKGNKYLSKLDSVHDFVLKTVTELPDSQRVLITAHDAFGYFGKKYNFNVKGVQGVSTASESGIREITELVDFIIKNNIKAIFVENSVSERNINSIIEGCKEKGHDLKLGGTLCSDALGDEKSGANTYLKMIKSNITTIVSALK